MEILKPKSVKIPPALHERASAVAKQIGYSYNKFVATAMEDSITMIESKRPVIPRMVMMAKAASTQAPSLLKPSHVRRSKKRNKK